MTYFSLRKHQPEPAPVEEDLDEVVDELDEETEPVVDEAPAEPPGSLGALLLGVCGPSSWIAARFGTGWAWGVHVVAVWAVGFYGGWTAAGIILAWLAAVLLFIPKEYLDRATAWTERRTARTPDETQPEAAEDAPADPRHALAQWLLDTIGKRPGIHLRELYPAMRELPGHEGRTDAELRALLRAFDVPVHRSLRLGRVAGRSGVRRGDVEALLPSDGESPVDSGGDAGQSADSPPLSGVGEEVKTT
jgi:hypothetical protein